MSTQESGNPVVGDSQDATPSDHAQNGALVPQAASLPMPMGLSTAPQKVDVIRGGMDSASLYHSFRRRWLLAICTGLGLGLLTAGILYFAFPKSSSVVAMFRVAGKQTTVLTDGVGSGSALNYDTFKRTQMVLIKSPYVLNAVLNTSGIKDSSVFDDVEQDKRIEWLGEELQVAFPQDSEVLQIRLDSSAPVEETAAVVDAVSKAYIDEVVFREHTERLKPVEILRASEQRLQADIRRKTDDYIALVKEGGRSDAYEGVDPETTIQLSTARELSRGRAEAEQKLAELVTFFAQQRRFLTDPMIMEKRIKDAVAADPVLNEYKTQIAGMEMQMATMQPAEAQQMQQMLLGYKQAIAAYQEKLLNSYEQQQEDEPNVELNTLLWEYKSRRAALEKQISDYKTQIDEIVETLKAKGEINTDLELKQAELEQLRLLGKSMAERIAQMDVEANAPQRVTFLGTEKTPAINTFQRYAISSIGGLLTFALTCFGIAYMEFRNRKLNGPEQVDEGLGIRVIGTLPSLSGRKSLDPNHPVVAQLTESIDSVRTALMHESTTKRRQVVLVTSAAAMEGRTTVASQLAASLARAGRRTLLVDGDLRRPTLHTLFDVPLEDGLSEVLRAEAEVSDIVNATHAPGLWLLTAGYCDADAVHALATDQAQPIFDKLRTDYDFIIIDGAPVLGLADSLLFGQHCDGAILSVLRDHTNVPKIHQSAELLKSVGIRLIGSVVNGVPIKADRRVTHLQLAGSKTARKQLENAEA